jgi:predicted transcriptional regulator
VLNIMASMSPEIAILRALLRLARRRSPASLDEILVRVDADADEARRALNALARAGLVHDTQTGPRLTMAGFAVAVAMAATPPAKQPRKRQASVAAGAGASAGARARVLPLVRRRRAA